MASRRHYYKKQFVQHDELNAGFDGLEAADRNLTVDQGITGIVSGLEVAEHDPAPNLTVDISLGTAYDQQGQRVRVASNQVLNLAVDYLGVSTAVSTSSNKKILSIFARFKRTLSDERTDGDGQTVHFVQEESFELRVVQGSEGSDPSPPELLSDAILLADVEIEEGQTEIVEANISYARRQWAFSIDEGSHEIREGTAKAALAAVLELLTEHEGEGEGAHAATAIAYGGGGNWADGTTNPAASVAEQLSKIISDLATGDGVARLACAARNQWLGGRTNPAANAYDAINKIILDLSATSAGDDGAERIGAEAVHGFTLGNVRSQLNQIAPGAEGTAYSAPKTFNGASTDASPALKTTHTITGDRKLLWEINTGSQAGTNVKVRLYAYQSTGGVGGFEVTFNALWNGSQWEQDDGDNSSSRFGIGRDSFFIDFQVAESDPWDDDAFHSWIGASVFAGLLTSGAITQECFVGYHGPAPATGNVGALAMFPIPIAVAPSSVTYSDADLPADINIDDGTSNTLASQTTLIETGLYVYAVPESASEETRFVRRAFVV